MRASVVAIRVAPGKADSIGVLPEVVTLVATAVAVRVASFSVSVAFVVDSIGISAAVHFCLLLLP